jgi:hypothetical protein
VNCQADGAPQLTVLAGRQKLLARHAAPHNAVSAPSFG